MNSLIRSVLLATSSGLCLPFAIAGVGARADVRPDVSLIGSTAGAEERLMAEQQDLRAALAVIDQRIQAGPDGDRRNELQRLRENLVTRSQVVEQSLKRTRVSVARVKLRILKADQSALRANLAAIDARLLAETDEARLATLREQRAAMLTREVALQRTIEEAEGAIDTETSSSAGR